MSHDWKIDFRCFRFYFEREGDWWYILDVHKDDVDEQDVNQIIEELNAADWQQVSKTHSGKRVPYFKDRKFVHAVAFREWPQKVKYRHG